MHTLSTAVGSPVPGASVFGLGNGTAPRARAWRGYRVCFPPVNGSECFDADILAAFDAAIHYGVHGTVHVLSLYLGGEPSSVSFHAVRRGVAVVCSAGNSGPALATAHRLQPRAVDPRLGCQHHGPRVPVLRRLRPHQGSRISPR
jgi:hypothetical protein